MNLHGRLKATYLGLGRTLAQNRLLDYKWLAEQEVNSWKHWTSLPLRRRIWLWRHGFTSPYGILYDFETHGPDAFLSELQRYRLYRSLNGDHRYLVDDKLSQHRLLSAYPDNRPTAYGLIDGGLLHGVAGVAYDGDPVPAGEWLAATLRTDSPLVLKSLRGKGGSEVLVAGYEDGYVLDDEPVSEAALLERVAGLSGYIVTEFVQQHPYADALYPHAANTIRLLTLWDEAGGELLVPVAVHRIGTDRSRPIDNCSRGGLTAELDLETGELGPATQYPFWSGEIQWFDSHPDTGSRIAGTVVPDWQHVLSVVEELAMATTDVPVIGWDVVVDRSGRPVVVEANSGTAVRTLQVHRPLLADDRVAAVVSRHLPEVEAPSVDASGAEARTVEAPGGEGAEAEVPAER